MQFRRFFAAAMILAGATLTWSQATGVVAIRAGRLFDPKSGNYLSNQVVLVTGDRITDVGAASDVKVPADAKVIDLSKATVLPGMIDGHVHLTIPEGGLQHQVLVALSGADQSMDAGFTTLVSVGTHGGRYADVEVRNAINSGLVDGPRILAAGPLLIITSPGNGPDPLVISALEGDSMVANGPEEMRKAVRELAHNGVDLVKIIMNGRFSFKANGEMVNQPLFTLEETKAVVDEAHRLGLFVASHSYGGDPLKFAIEAGVDDIQHGDSPDASDIQMLVQKNLPITTITIPTGCVDADLKRWSPYSREREIERTWKPMHEAGVKLGFGSGSAPPYGPDCSPGFGNQAKFFSNFIRMGATPLDILRMVTIDNAGIIRKQDSIGSIDKGKFADIIAVQGDPLQDIKEMQRVFFVMKGGKVMRDDRLK